MMQDYDFLYGLEAESTNTSSESVSIERPSRQTIQNIKAFARCMQTLTIDDLEIRICLN